MSAPRVAVAHEWLTNWAGSERVAQQMVRVSGATQLVAAVVDRELASEHFDPIDVRALWPSRLPAAREHWSRYALPMMAAWATTRIRADALIVSSHFAAHAAAMHFAGPSIVYYHTPARLFWGPDLELERLDPRVRAVAKRLLPAFRQWDKTAASHPTVVLANSNAVASRIRLAYGRTAQVLHPPVDLAPWNKVERREPRHLLMLGRLVAYKNPRLGVEAAHRCGLPLLVVGDGPEKTRLEATAPPNVRFLGRVSDAEMRDALAHAYALLMPGEEDFGIAAVEALAAGVPVVAYAAGGALDYVVDELNGLLVHTNTSEDFAHAAKDAAFRRWDHDAIRRSAERFSVDVFRVGFAQILATTFGGTWL